MTVLHCIDAIDKGFPSPTDKKRCGRWHFPRAETTKGTASAVPHRAAAMRALALRLFFAGCAIAGAEAQFSFSSFRPDLKSGPDTKQAEWGPAAVLFFSQSLQAVRMALTQTL
jgi:hypothetical protein